MNNMQPKSTDLAVPTALMALIHNDKGQPLQRFAPAKCAAFAELAELSVRGFVDVDGNDITSARVFHEGPGWAREVSAKLADLTDRRPVPVAHWLRRRPRAYAEHRDIAVAEGVLVEGRARLLGVPYRTTVAQSRLRSDLIATLTAGHPAANPRISALASIVVGYDIVSVLSLDAGERERLTAAASDTAAFGMSASMVAALATVGFLTLTG